MVAGGRSDLDQRLQWPAALHKPVLPGLNWMRKYIGDTSEEIPVVDCGVGWGGVGWGRVGRGGVGVRGVAGWGEVRCGGTR